MLLRPSLWVSNIFYFWNWQNKQNVYYMVGLGIESFFFIACTCVTWNMLMYWWHFLKLFSYSSLELKNVDFKIFVAWQYMALAQILFSCILNSEE